jgi:hypothetical protein
MVSVTSFERVLFQLIHYKPDWIQENIVIVAFMGINSILAFIRFGVRVPSIENDPYFVCSPMPL